MLVRELPCELIMKEPPQLHRAVLYVGNQYSSEFELF